MKAHIYWKNKPLLRGFDSNGKYFEYRDASYRGHLIVRSMEELQIKVTDLFSKNRDVTIEFEN